MSDGEPGGTRAEMPTWVGVLVIAMLLTPVVLMVAATGAWLQTTFFVVFALLYVAVLIGPALLYDRYFGSSPELRLSGFAKSIVAMVGGAVAGLTAHAAVSIFATLDHTLAKSVFGGAMFALVWYLAGDWLRGRLRSDEA